MNDFTDKTAFITGGGSGIGLAIARAFAARGAGVMLADLDEDRLEAAVGAIPGAAAIRCDVADEASMRDAAAACVERFGKVHFVVNNAGVGFAGQPGETPLRDWRWIVDINLMGVVHGVEIFTPLIRDHGEGGHFINTASMAGHLGAPGIGPYTATKFAVVGYSETLRHDLEPHGIGVSVLCPGWVRTNIAAAGGQRPSGAAAGDDRSGEMAQAVVQGIDADLVGAWTVECVAAGRFYIFTHPEMAPFIDQRLEELRRDFAACAAEPRFKGEGGAPATI